MPAPDPNCPDCGGTGRRRTFLNSTVSGVYRDVAGGSPDLEICPCTNRAPAAAFTPTGGPWRKATILLAAVFVGIPILLIALLQVPWIKGLFDKSMSDRINDIADSATFWTGTATCEQGTHPVIVKSTMVPAAGESLTIMILDQSADAAQVLEHAVEVAEERAKSVSGDVQGIALAKDLPEGSLASSVTLWGGGDVKIATYKVGEKPKIVGDTSMAARSATATFTKSDGSMRTELSGSTCTSITAKQP